MKTRAAVVHDVGQQWVIEEVEIDPPKAGEVLVKTIAAGLCHSDEHLLTGDMAISNESAQMFGIDRMFPVIGGHEGAGIVLEVGAGVTALQPGDHVATSFVPSCGRCKMCSTGRQNLCDRGAGTFARGMITDGTARHHLRGEDLATLAKLGTFAEHMLVAEDSLIKVDADLPLPAVCLVSCGVATGWGSAVKRAEVKPGDILGEKLADLGRTHQVICVTHLPQVASYARWQWTIRKATKGKRTTTTISPLLTEDERLEELACMMRGEAKGETTLKEAAAMLKTAKKKW